MKSVIPGALAHRRLMGQRTGLPGVEEDHELRPASGEVVRTYRRGDAYVVVVLRDTQRDVVLVSGPAGQALWAEVCGAVQTPRTGEVVELFSPHTGSAGS